MIRNLMPALFPILLAGVLALWVNLGQAHAHEGETNGGDLHVIGLSSGASLALLLAACCVVVLFLGIFVWKWRQSLSEASGMGKESGITPQNNGGG